MDMIRHAADAEAFAIHVADDRSEIGVQGRADGDVEYGITVFRTEDDVREKVGKRLRHGSLGWGGPTALRGGGWHQPGPLAQAGIGRADGARTRPEHEGPSTCLPADREGSRHRSRRPADQEGQGPGVIPAWANGPGIRIESFPKG